MSECVGGVFGAPLYLIVPAFLEKVTRQLETDTVQALLSGKWNPESGSQTFNHTFILFIHSHSGAQPETPEGGDRCWIQECMLGNRNASGGLEKLVKTCCVSRNT
ncbi:hypothetical protein ILYODFUR_023072 [Ilyodon furcidens]|uniref:Uncharacterized protein n=1 Tax=Ilyodon furcidens TaxID=33524 RepID=A0ABV0UKA6_9TELE